MKTGNPSKYPDMPFRTTGLGPPTYGLNAQYMMANFDVSLEDIRNYFIAYTKPRLVYREQAQRIVIAGDIEKEMEALGTHEQMSNFASLMMLDESQWVGTRATARFVPRPKVKQTVADDDAMELDDIQEEGSDDDVVEDWSEEMVQQTKEKIGPELQAMVAGIYP